MADPIASAPSAAAMYPPPYDPEIGDYSSYKPLAKTAWAKDGSDERGLSFADFLDVINPLQHLPIISVIYRAITGDEIGLGAKLAGDTLYGGPIGLLASGVTAALESTAGKSTGEMLAELAHDVFGGDGGAPAATQEARAQEPDPVDITWTVPPPLAKPEIAAATGDDEAAQRISKSIAEARRAQAGMLLASVQQDDPTPRASREAEPKRDTEPKHDTEPKPAANPYLPPDRPAAVTSWSNETLAETIARYERAVAANRR